MHCQPRKMGPKHQIQGWPRATAAPLLWSSCSQESMRAALLAISQKKRQAWQGEQGVQPDSTRRRSEAHPARILVTLFPLCGFVTRRTQRSGGLGPVAG